MIVRKKFYSSLALSAYVKDSRIPESAIVDVETHGNELTLIYRSGNEERISKRTK